MHESLAHALLALCDGPCDQTASQVQVEASNSWLQVFPGHLWMLPYAKQPYGRSSEAGQKGLTDRTEALLCLQTLRLLQEFVFNAG